MEVVNMGRTNIVLDHELLDQCRKLTGIKTTRALVDYALHELRRLALRRSLMELKGSVIWKGDLAVWRKERNNNDF